MMAMMMVAMSMPPQPPEAKPRFQPEKCPEITAPTPSAHNDHTPAWRLVRALRSMRHRPSDRLTLPVFALLQAIPPAPAPTTSAHTLAQRPQSMQRDGSRRMNAWESSRM